MPSSRYYRFKVISKNEKIEKLRFLFFLLLSIGVAIIASWLIFMSPIFDIRNIKISDNIYLDRGGVERILASAAPFGLSKNLLILSKSRLESELAAAFPQIINIRVGKKMPHTLTINFQKRTSIGIWCGGNNCYYFDKDGIIFSEAPQTEGGLILKITDFSQNRGEVSPSGKILNAKIIDFIVSFEKKINESGKFKILEFKIKPSPSIDLEAVTDQNWSIYLDEKQNAAATANNLFTILEEITPSAENLEYIDLRIFSRVFYK